MTIVQDALSFTAPSCHHRISLFQGIDRGNPPRFQALPQWADPQTMGCLLLRRMAWVFAKTILE
jgi:hypothetical protein